MLSTRPCPPCFDLSTGHKGACKIAYSISGTAIEPDGKPYRPWCSTIFSGTWVEQGVCWGLSEDVSPIRWAFCIPKQRFVRPGGNNIERQWKNTLVRIRKFSETTELIYNNEIATLCRKWGYQALICEGLDHILDHRSPNFIYHPPPKWRAEMSSPQNYKLSDDIAFRFADQGWNDWATHWRRSLLTGYISSRGQRRNH